MLCFQPFWVEYQAKEAFLLVLHLSKSSTEAITCIPQIVTYLVVEKGMEHKGAQRRTKVSIGITIILVSVGAAEVGKQAHLGSYSQKVIQ